MHEWGHLRWGLRDEYPVDGYPQFYRDSDGKWAAVRCGKFMNGRLIGPRGEKCLINRNTIQPLSNCHFEADTFDAGVEASIMSYHNVPGVSLSEA